MAAAGGERLKSFPALSPGRRGKEHAKITLNGCLAMKVTELIGC